jgi:glutamate-1-semialdehyde 2,1-aminomutase
VSRTAEVKDKISDLQFTEAYRAPFQFRRLAREYLGAGTFVRSLSGAALTDLDGDCFLDLTGRHFCPVQPLSLSRRAAPDGKKHAEVTRPRRLVPRPAALAAIVPNER